MMLPRLQLLRELLREDGSIWVTIDDNEGHYLKVLMDEVFGRGNFVDTVIWQKADSPLLVYGEACRLGQERLTQAKVTFKHIPYDVRARRGGIAPHPTLPSSVGMKTQNRMGDGCVRYKHAFAKRTS